MAIIKLSGLLTEIRGSVGGTTFRKIGSKATMYNKDLSRAGHGKRNGGNIEFLNKLSQQWSNLTKGDRQAWRTKASGYDRIDRFGNLVPYTGRELFFHMISTRTIFGESSLSVGFGNDNIYIPDVSPPVIRPDLRLSITFPIVNSEAYVLCNIQNLGQAARYESYKRTKLIFDVNFSVSTSVLTNPLDNITGKPFNSGDNVAIYLVFCSSSGLRSEPQFYIAVA